MNFRCLFVLSCVLLALLHQSLAAKCTFVEETTSAYKCEFYCEVSECESDNLQIKGMHLLHKYDHDVETLTNDPSSVMKFIPRNALKKFINLKELSLNKAGICELSPLEAIVNLRRVFLKHNEITEMPDETFSNCLNIDLIDLSNNRITEINEKSFLKLRKLTNLQLNSNLIASIHPLAFHSNIMLTTLSLYNNKIIKIESRTFHNLPNLNKLWLNQNQIAQISPQAFNLSLKLEVFNANSNDCVTGYHGMTFNNTYLKNCYDNFELPATNESFTFVAKNIQSLYAFCIIVIVQYFFQCL